MKRKDFLKALTFSGLSSFFTLTSIEKAWAAPAPVAKKKGSLVAILGGEPAEMLDRLFKEIGGVGRFVKPGSKVVLKPNIGWAKQPNMAANTNPELIGALTKLCLDAGAKEVLVFDHTCNEWRSCYELSGIEKAVETAGGKMVPGNDESYYREVSLPQGVKLKKTKIHKAILDCDVWFNIPVLKHHGGAKLSISMKNYMGINWDRSQMHKIDLQQCIADLNTFHKKPALHIVDAYRIMKQNGPQGKSIEDTALAKGLFASTDPIAVDTAAGRFFNQVEKMDLTSVTHILLGEKLRLGTSDLNQMQIKRIKI